MPQLKSLGSKKMGAMQPKDSSPWASIWLNPRETIRKIVQTDVKKCLLWLCAIYGIPMALNLTQNLAIAETVPLWAIVVGAVVFSPFLGLIAISVVSWLLHVSGRWIGGAASFAEVRAAVAWSNVPNLVSIAVWGVLIGMFGGQIFGQGFAQMPVMGTQAGILFIVMLLEMVASIWGFVLLLSTLAEVQKFSLWRSFFNLLIPFAAVVVFFWLLGAIVL